MAIIVQINADTTFEFNPTKMVIYGALLAAGFILAAAGVTFLVSFVFHLFLLVLNWAFNQADHSSLLTQVLLLLFLSSGFYKIGKRGWQGLRAFLKW
jgi:hypothetical protein